MLPLEWAIAEGETNESWSWFPTHVKECMEAQMVRDG